MTEHPIKAFSTAPFISVPIVVLSTPYFSVTAPVMYPMNDLTEIPIEECCSTATVTQSDK